MCRLLGVVSSGADTLPQHLGADLDAFTGLSKVHCDGWGIAYWDAHDDLVSAKYPEPALGSERFQAAVESARTDAALLHLRKASVNMANTEQNTHPFLAGSVAFAHNGYLSPRSELDRLVSEAGGRPSQGDTDSERYFSLVLAELRHSGPVEALHEVARKIADSAEVVSLNCLLLTHDALYASARYDEKVITAQGADVASYELNYRVTPGSVTVASSGWARPAPWLPLTNGQILEISRTSLRTAVHVLR